MLIDNIDNEDILFSYEPILPFLRCNDCFKERMFFIRNKIICSVCGNSYKIKKGVLNCYSKKQKLTPISFVNNFKPIPFLYEELWRRKALSILSENDIFHLDEFKILFDYLNVDEGGIFLDIGCSTGYYSRAIAKELKKTGKKGFVIALDISLEMLEKAQLYARAEGVEDRIFFIRANAGELPFKPMSINKILCSGSLNENKNPYLILKEVKRVISQEGNFFVINTLKSKEIFTNIFQKAVSLGGLNFHDINDYFIMFDRVGFKVLEGYSKNLLMIALLTPQHII